MTAIAHAPVQPASPRRVARILERAGSASTLSIALGAGLASLSMNFWIPFLPLYMLHLGATSDANALFWVALATTGQGFARLLSGPLWGILSDRVGRKLMFIRALYFATGTTLIAAFATEPWHVAIAFLCQGLFSGFIPAAVALTSVTVEDSKLSSSLGLVTGAQYLGNTVGPALGAGLAILFGMRGAIAASALMPALAATLVIFTVPRDRTELASSRAAAAERANHSIRSIITAQFVLVLFLYFVLFSMSQVVRLSTPIALKDIAGEDSTGLVGVAFTAGGVGSVIGVLVVGRRWLRTGQFRTMLVAGCLASALLHVLLAAAGSEWLFIGWFTVISLVQAAMLPASNTLIASNVPRARRGTAFGFAGSAQALAFMAGPMSAAGFAAASLAMGFVVLGALFAALALLLHLTLAEPHLE
ncbi:MAG: MFS transporter [Dehalococcoidia bacterium]|nr:MFS transporter [Dehalococcoidia bacterium]